MSEQLQSNLLAVSNFLIGTFGAVLGAVGIVVFLVPADIAALGVGGLAVLGNDLVGLPIGVLMILLNIPILYLSYRMLPGGLPMIGNMIVFTIIYAVATDAITPMVQDAVSDDHLLNAIFGGILLGISGGLIYRSNNTLGGTYALALILRRRFGTPMSTTFFYTDSIVIVGAGLVFGIEGALYSVVVLFINGIAQDYVMEGPSVVRNIMIVTDWPEATADAIMAQLQVGVTRVDAEGMYQRRSRGLLYVTISRARAYQIREIVSEIDPNAFMVVGQGHVAFGGGFRPMVKRVKARPSNAA